MYSRAVTGGNHRGLASPNEGFTGKAGDWNHGGIPIKVMALVS